MLRLELTKEGNMSIETARATFQRAVNEKDVDSDKEPAIWALCAGLADLAEGIDVRLHELEKAIRAGRR